MMGSCQGERHGPPEGPGDGNQDNHRREEPPMRTAEDRRAYARYLLTALSAVAFGLSTN